MASTNSIVSSTFSTKVVLAVPNKEYTAPSSGHGYIYIHHLPTDSSKPTLLFLHGFPSTSADWHHQIKYFHSKGYGLLVPDLLGYGGSNAPLDVSDYLGSVMSKDIIEILDSEGLTNGTKLVGIAHDWGTYLLSQLACRFQDRFSKFVFLSVPYTPPGRKGDIATFNKKSKAKFGYEIMGYWMFLSTERAGSVIARHWEKFFNMVYARDPDLWKIWFAPLGAMETYLENTPVEATRKFMANWVNEGDKQSFGKNFEETGFKPACLWYKRGIEALGVEEERKGIHKGEIEEIIRKKTLMICGLRDPVCLADIARSTMGAFVEKGMLRVENLDAGHWLMLEKNEETNRLLEEFLMDELNETGAVKSLL